LGGVALDELARDQASGTPTYVYDLDAIAREARELIAAFDGAPGLVAFAVKANGAGPIVRALAREGCGADVVSGGELALALACGVAAKKIVYSGVAKTDDELDLALTAGGTGIGAVQVESLEELTRVAARGAALGVRARVSVRVNPGVEEDTIGTHAHISTGHDEAKFGVSLGDIDAAIERANASTHLDLIGFAAHVGSQLASIEPYAQGARVLFELAARAIGRGAPIAFVDTGGGMGIDYGGGYPSRPAEFVRAAREVQRVAGLERLSLHVEPGRALVGAHGVLLASVIQTKRATIGGAPRRWLMVDAGMNDLIRPALYQARHRVVPLVRGAGEASTPWRVVGPVCESSDDFGEHLLGAEPPARVAILDAGAYGFTMASQYNGRALATEVFVRGGRVVARTERAPRDAWVRERAGVGEG